MNAVEFLREKKMLTGEAVRFPIIGAFGWYELTSLLDEYAQRQPAVAGPDVKIDLPKATGRNTKKKKA